ncbi:RNA dependent RNA polymerase-domain-containing protein [Mycotypha africana]|uniref:RNA dependent RNA polymerase-domain-containing protein n=1 Tax=Mycotypha africana TaxID=64632 RepID=UPI002301AA26|nr:RNA dependent RNA polymerase-domain-containing protein [Mycotypha africana]KAI8969197.1 RNA dependent RNA polymerase-domain-containing protein [Mycotypha africana]
MKFLPSEKLTENVHGYIIFNLNSEVDRDALQKVFGQFGNLVEIQIRKDDEIKAAVIYSSQPSDQLFTQSIYIHGRLISVRPLSMAEYIRGCSQPVHADKLSLGGLNSPQVFIEEWSTDQYVLFDLNLNENYMDIFFAHIDAYYRVRIVYDNELKNSLMLQRYHNITSLTISGKYPAYFWRSKVPVQRIENLNLYYLSKWERITEIPMDDFSRDMIRHKTTTNPKWKKEPVTPDGQFPEYLMKLNMWTVYRLEFQIPFSHSSNHLGEHCLTHEMLERKLSLAAGVSIGGDQHHAEILVRPPSKTPQVDAQIASIPSFNVRYMLEHAFNLKILRAYNVSTDFFEKMRQFPPQVSCMFLSILSAPQQRIYNVDAAIAQAYRLCKAQIGFQQPLPDGYVLLRRVIVTPTSIYPLQPTVERMTHLQRQFQQHADRFLKVYFTDEDLCPLIPYETHNHNEAMPTVESRNSKIYERIYTVLRRGLRIANRFYEFLGSSLTDTQSHSCWFFAPLEECNRNDILRQMGDFSEIQTVAKYVSCTGQSHQPALLNLVIDLSEIEEIDDFIRNDCNFSKECGKMSPEIAREISKRLDMNCTPSVVKFNLCGAKGILMLSNYLKKRKIQLRSSQIQFKSEDTTLEVIKVSKPNKLFLNNRFITILSSMGIRNYVFDDLLDEGMAFVEKHMNVEGKDHLNLMIEHYSNGGFHSFEQIIKEGDFTARCDPFITNLVRSFQNQLLKGWKEDTRLYVHKGVRVFAIMDETNTLAKGEVFLQITRNRYGTVLSRHVIQGPCVVFRENSCFPSDVRVVHAVDYKELRHYVNVLVYSVYDLCDLPSICSNDAPDDDNFNIIWDKRLIPPKVHLTDHRNYTTVVSPKSLKKISFTEAAKFFTTYISKDVSPILKEAYIALADWHKEGIFNGACIHLSQQINRALDFVKTGVYASLSDESRQFLYPDFMKQSDLNSYTSDKPVGRIYRKVKEYQYQSLASGQCVYDPRLYVDDMYRYIKDARKTKAKYDHSLRLLLAQFSVETEIEFITGHIILWPKYLPENEKDVYCTRIRSAFLNFRKYWKDVFESELNLTYDKKLENQREAKAAAWYYVTYHPSEYTKTTTAIYPSSASHYLSFPWVVDKEIAHIAMKNSKRPILPEHSRPIPPEKIEQHIDSVALVLDDDEDEDSSSEEEEEEEEEDEEGNEGLKQRFEANNSKQACSSSPSLFITRQESIDSDSSSHPSSSPSEDDIDDEPAIVNIKLADLSFSDL